MADFANSESVILKRVRLDYFDIFTKGEPQDEKDKGNPDKWKYKARVIFAPDSDAAAVAKAAMLDAAKKLWGDNAANMIRAMAKNSKALRDGNDNLTPTGDKKPEYVDMLYLATSNKMKPTVVAQKQHNGKFVNITPEGRGVQIDPERPGQWKDVTDELGYPITVPYRGCYVNLKVTLTAGKANSAKNLPNQVFAKLEAVQFAADGEAFGAGPTSAEGFGDEEVAAGSNAEELF